MFFYPDDIQLRNVLSGYHPEILLGHIYNNCAESRSHALDAGEDEQAKYDELMCSEVLKVLNNIRGGNGQVRLSLMGGRIQFLPCPVC